MKTTGPFSLGGTYARITSVHAAFQHVARGKRGPPLALAMMSGGEPAGIGGQ
jgi:hypothetical protein